MLTLSLQIVFRRSKPNPTAHAEQSLGKAFRTCPLIVTVCMALLLFVIPHGSSAQILDEIVFGNPSSENSHFFAPTLTQAYVGGMGQTARQLLPQNPATPYGGQMTFTMATDPQAQNYFTVKTYGSEASTGDQLLLKCEGREIGGRHGGQPQDQLLPFGGPGGTGTLPNQWVYKTVPLPFWMTQGRTSITLTIFSLGWLAAYDSSGVWQNMYKVITQPSPGAYCGYTSTDPCFAPPASEAQGTAPTLSVLPPPVISTYMSSYESAANATLTSDLNSTTTLTPVQLQYIAQAYNTTWTVAYQNPSFVNRFIADMDAQVTLYYANTTNTNYTADWGGYFWQAADGIRRIYAQLQSSLSTSVNYGGAGGTLPRSQAWGTAIRASLDYARFNRRDYAGNQSYTNDCGIYYNNKALELIYPSLAMTESQALRYIYETSGNQPYLGSDLLAGGSAMPFGPDYYMTTPKGQSREANGWTGSSYGDLVGQLTALYQVSADATILARDQAMVAERSYFRYPSGDSNNDQIMLTSDEIDGRNLGYPGGEFYSDIHAGAIGISPDATSYAQQWIASGQIFPYDSSSGNLTFPDDYNALVNTPSDGVVLPQTDGQPDFAWADENNGAVSIKHGSERMFMNLYWRGTSFVNSLARVYDRTPQYDRLSDGFEQDFQYTSTGNVYAGGRAVETDVFTAPDNPVAEYYNILFGESNDPQGQGGIGTGYASGYTFRYGNYLVGMNHSQTKPYAVETPPGFSVGTDLITGQTFTAPITLQPLTTVIFYLPTIPATEYPSPSILCAASAGKNVLLSWQPAPGATSYTVERGTVSGGPYTALATGGTATSYVDNGVTLGTSYYYIVVGNNASGAGTPSVEASATPYDSDGLPAPWCGQDVGTTGVAGSASISNSVFTLNGAGPGAYNTADGFHYVSQPVEGDTVITARVTSVGTMNVEGGVMFRQSMDPSSPYVDIKVNNGAVKMEYRSTQGASAGNIYNTGTNIPVWIRLQRSGPIYYGYSSTDGVNWTLIGTLTIAMPDTCLVGLTCSSHSNTAISSATFDNVSVTGTAAPHSLTAIPGNGQVTLTWTGSSNAVSYNVKRVAQSATCSSGPPYTSEVTGVTGTTFTDSSVTNGTIYFYAVSAVNAAGGESDNTNQACAAPLGPPSAPTGLTAMSGIGSVVLSWSGESEANAYIVQRSNSSGGPFATITNSCTSTTFADSTVTAGQVYYYQVAASDWAGASQFDGPVQGQSFGPLPSPWRDSDIGSVAQTGSAQYAMGTFLVNGSGTQVWTNTDSFNYCYQQVTGDCTIVAQLAAQQGGKMGVMLRSSLAANSPFVDLNINYGFGTNFEYRTSAGGSSSNSYGSGSVTSPPTWFKLQRVGTTVTGYTSPDGSTWTQASSVTEPNLGTVVYIGMWGCAESSTALDTYRFGNVAVAGTTVIPATTATVAGTQGSGGWYTSACQITLTATDPAFSTTSYFAVDGGSTQTYSSAFTVGSDGAHSVAYWSVDQAGNSEPTNALQLKIDATAPTLSFGAASPAPNANGWNNAPVTMPYSASDATSGVATAAPGSPLTFSAQGANQTQTVAVADNAGNSASFASPAVSIDTAPPATTESGAANGGSYTAAVMISLSATDALSGVAATYYTVDSGAQTAYSAPFSVSTAGSHTVAYWSADKAGNVESPHSLTFAVSLAPSISSFAPTSGVQGSKVTISGANFTGATYVRFNGASTSFTLNSPTQITATVPSKGSTGKIAVTTPQGTAASAGSFTYLYAPTVASFSPTSGVAGSSVTITGTNFAGVTYVRFNGASTSFTVNSATKITATVPTLGSSGTISVTTAAGTASSAGTFTYLYAPTVTSFTPTTGTSGTAVTITGTGFTGATYVRFNGASTSFTVNSPTQITAKVPGKGSTGKISVTTAAGTGTSAGTFTY